MSLPSAWLRRVITANTKAGRNQDTLRSAAFVVFSSRHRRYGLHVYQDSHGNNIFIRPSLEIKSVKIPLHRRQDSKVKLSEYSIILFDERIVFFFIYKIATCFFVLPSFVEKLHIIHHGCKVTAEKLNMITNRA